MGVKNSTVAAATRSTLTSIAKTHSPAGRTAIALATRLDDPDCPATAMAAIAKELRATLTELTRDTVAKGDPIDELRSRREARRRGA